MREELASELGTHAGPVETGRVVVLIDDNAGVHALWSLLKPKEITLLQFFDVEGFNKIKHTLGRDISIYVDYDLILPAAGYKVSHDLSKIDGFRNVSMTTGYHANELPQMDWVSQVISKSPPWIGMED